MRQTRSYPSGPNLAITSGPPQSITNSKDARCYPSLETLGTSLGVSERQARDYVKELERTGLIVVEQRGLRKTNVYLFVWTAELERLSNSVPDCGEDLNETGGGTPQGSSPDRNTSSGPIGINSGGISSLESSSSSSADEAGKPMKTTTPVQPMPSVSPVPPENEHEVQTISRWAQERGIQRDCAGYLISHRA